MEMPAIPQPTFYIFKCEQSAPPGMPKPSCVTEQSRDLFNYLAQTMMQKGLMGPVQAIRTSCLGRCQMGPVMLVEPGHHMYCQLSKEKIDKIIEEHIIGGTPVQEYLIPEQFWGAPISLS
ncbi:(2Fe-2S) ferredoxin domain-containing protein [Halarcobacter anaerophilus]|jgi:(2Fe-2S) ferredoxin|uniref:Ferredoxin n=1 Tax=Halarcobacter anaerophilus TaxID=877500 RepID=A0A4Q0XY23_9BACT|nr:(2Fe-2S) ferredoxin domain-containing protein [Halarcobacter anaerophilus]QDF28116.1 thioredoxin-like [2Fe-2S] ferredoxin [Halarcobacter anaerophilus]RXJ62462.1 ferredoxin [Halarcobacter anaerophilus]